MPIILKAAPVIEKAKTDLRNKTQELKGLGVVPKLSIILVGENPASKLYVANKKRFAHQVGIDCRVIELPEKISSQEALEVVEKLNQDSLNHGILIQLPLPPHLNSSELTQSVDPSKDVDGLHPFNQGLLLTNPLSKDGLTPCTPSGIIELLKEYKIELASKHIAVIGRSQIVGRPLSVMMTSENATVTLCHSKTKKLASIVKSADIVISAIGQPNLIDKNYVSTEKKQVFIDVGINRDPLTNELCGDTAFDEILPLCQAISPVPGGVGPMTILGLARNVVKAASKVKG